MDTDPETLEYEFEFIESNFSLFSNESEELEGSSRGSLYQVPLGIVLMLSTFYGAISLAAVLGNGLVLWVISISRRMRTVTNMFIANLALADIIIGLFAIPFQFQAALLQRWILPHFMCAFCPFITILSVNVSVFTLSAIALDRYRAILYPLSARVSKRKATIVILTIWTLGILIALPTEFDFNIEEDYDQWGSIQSFCRARGLGMIFRKVYHITIVFVQYFLPLGTLSIAYIKMGTCLWGSTAPGNAEDTRDAAILRNKKRVIKMLLFVVILFGVCWLPLQMYNFLVILFPTINHYEYINIIWFASHWVAMSNSCCNPFIYAIYNEKFQREFSQRLRCFKFCRRSHSGSPCTEVSEFDRGKMRNSYRYNGIRLQSLKGGIHGDTTRVGNGLEGGAGSPRRMSSKNLHKKTSFTLPDNGQGPSTPQFEMIVDGPSCTSVSRPSSSSERVNSIPSAKFNSTMEQNFTRTPDPNEYN